MSNVVQLFVHGEIENPAQPTTVAMANFLAGFDELARTIKELSKHLDSIDHLIDPIGDPEARQRHDQLRKESAIAVRKLSQAIKQMPISQIDALLESEQARGP